MSNGFPEGTFFLLNTQAMLCLAANPGGTTVVAESVTKSGSSVEYSHTLPPVPQVECPRPEGKNQFQGWYFDNSKDPWGKPQNLLVSRMKVSTLGSFGLHSFGDDQPEMWGVGRDGVATWQYKDGYVHLGDDAALVLTITDRNGSAKPVVTNRGGNYQQWHLIPFS